MRIVPSAAVTLQELRRRSVAQTLFTPRPLASALRALGFVQADPIRAPARAQDLVLRHRVKGYVAGDLERRYPRLDIQEDFFINYGFVTGSLYALMHPRTEATVPADGGRPWTRSRRTQAARVMDLFRTTQELHPREVEERFSQGTVANYWGGRSNATTHLLDAMLYHGLIRVSRRESGVRVYAAQPPQQEPTTPAERDARLDALADAALGLYAPLPASSLSFLLRKLRHAVPQWQSHLGAVIARARGRLQHARVEGVDWWWPERRIPEEPDDAVRLLAPFDPVVWDRARFELLWGWTYRFEAYTQPSRRKLGYYALPLLWRDKVIGWGNLTVQNGRLTPELGYINGAPKDRGFKRELDLEISRIEEFLRGG